MGIVEWWNSGMVERWNGGMDACVVLRCMLGVVAEYLSLGDEILA